MVNIAIAGGSGDVGQEVLSALVARGKHDILLLSRKDVPATELPSSVKWVKTNYSVEELTTIFKGEGVETVLSFVAGDPSSGAHGDTQKNLVDACIRAGVKRFAPSELAASKFEHMPWYTFKQAARDYLSEVNKDKKVLEYTLFHPGLFTNYMTFPFSSSKHVQLFETPIDFYNRRVLVIDSAEDVPITLTTAQDTAKVIALAVEYEGEWPLISGIKGSEATIRQLIALGEKIRGGPFAVEKLKKSDLLAGTVNASWMPKITHQSMSPEAAEALAPVLLSGILLGFENGNFSTTDEWNKLLPEYEFTQPEEFLSKAWSAIDAGAKSVFDDY
ncbi:NmrA-like family protein [Colletotrichum karsti]|uniref:NmrA-like family protein n=1 Tax=Colletotrichum karsti TaxID=1095194 RepID=A0A9P6HVZ5_9PEZI|nr:NmrA-like family protein [Colletotrichum karsti]KAF9871389.1 NmrA-like family protein [Colletotrichum karsti]